MSDSYQSTLWYMDPLGQAAPVHDDLGGSSLLQGDYFTTICAKTHLNPSECMCFMHYSMLSPTQPGDP